MVESIFAEQSLAARLIDGDQPHDHRVGRSGLSKGDRLLVDDAARPGIDGNVPQPELFGALLVAD